ncbi:MAG: DUF1295 domain-containing protein [Ardenticatenaceae bacterium]|nr:DUF1295 domain-containing protein [Ardenticatenaceae bacterium]
MLLDWFEPQLGDLLTASWPLLIIALLVSSLGFYRVVYFISVGYAFSIVGMALFTTINHFDNLTWVAALQNLFLVLWGARLGVFLVYREFRTTYRRELGDVAQRSAGMAWSRKAIIWISVSILYLLMFSPSLFRLLNGPSSSWIGYFVEGFGLLLMGSGLLIEAAGDRQKSAFKVRFPNQFCNEGLYRWVRCPNYLGEITFWVGHWIVGVTVYNTPLRWLASLIGVICLMLIMMGSTKRLEEKQDRRYGDQPAYQAYVQSVPVLFPFVPVYSLKNVRVYLE